MVRKMATQTTQHLQLLKKTYPWIQTPLVISAPMRVFAGPALATAVSRAGGIGFMGPGATPSELDTALSSARSLLSQKETEKSTSLPKTPVPIGIGFQTFDADLEVAVREIKKHIPAAVWLFAPRNGQEELDEWTRRIRDVSPETGIWIQVGSVKDAVAAAKSKDRPDVLILQGIDAGGHGLAKGAGIISLLPETQDALAELRIQIPLIAAGGIADGRGVASALSLGAVGAVMGTRFLASSEANIPKGYQRDVLRTRDGGQNTVRTTLYDHLAGRHDWPKEFDGRNVVNRSWTEKEQGVGFEAMKRSYEESKGKGDYGWGEEGRLTAYMGSAVGLVREVKGAGEIVERTRDEARDALLMARSLL